MWLRHSYGSLKQGQFLFTRNNVNSNVKNSSVCMVYCKLNDYFYFYFSLLLFVFLFLRYWKYTTVPRGGSRTAATSKMELFVIIVNGFQPLTIITKCSILDVAAVLDPPLVPGDCNTFCFISLCYEDCDKNTSYARDLQFKPP